MIEEDKGTGGTQEAPQEQSAASMSASQSMNALEGLTDMVSQETSTGMAEMLENKSTPPETANDQVQTELFKGVEDQMGEGVKPENTEVVAEAATEEEGAKGTETAPAAEQGETLDQAFEKVVSPLVGGEVEVGKPIEAAGSEMEAANFENIANLSGYLKESHGIEDIKSLGSKIEEWKGQSNELSDLSVKYSNVENLFKTMQKELHAAIDNFTKGLDWKESFNSSSIDYSKSVEDFSDKDVVESMMPGKITADDWEEFEDEDGDPNVKRLVQSAIDNSSDMFTRKKEQVKQEAERGVEAARQAQEIYTASISKSKEAFKQGFGQADSSVADEIEQAFNSPNGLASLFYNDNGTLREDAFSNYAMAKHGKGLMDQYRVLAERKIETKTTQDILATGATTPGTSQGSAASQGKDELRPEVQKEIDSIRSIVG